MYADRSVLGGLFGTGDGQNSNQDRQEKNDDHGKKISDVKIHSSDFLASATLSNHNPIVVAIPNSITSQLRMSTPPPINGATTLIAKNTFPALSQMLASRSNWEGVNTGSRSTKIIPDRIYSEDSTEPVEVSTDRIVPFISPCFA